MPQITKFKVNAIREIKNSNNIKSKEFKLEEKDNNIEDFVSPYEFLRRIIIRDKKMNRIIFKLYVGLPDNLRLNFVRKETDVVKEILKEAKEHGGVNMEKKKKKQDELFANYLEDRNTIPTSTFEFEICSIGEPDSTEYQTSYFRFFLPRDNHEVEIAVMEPDAKVMAQIKADKKLYEDLTGYFRKE